MIHYNYNSLCVCICTGVCMHTGLSAWSHTAMPRDCRDCIPLSCPTCCPQAGKLTCSSILYKGALVLAIACGHACSVPMWSAGVAVQWIAGQHGGHGACSTDATAGAHSAEHTAQQEHHCRLLKDTVLLSQVPFTDAALCASSRLHRHGCAEECLHGVPS